MQNAGVAIQDRGLDLNDAFGNLGPFITDATDVLDILNAPEGRRCKGLVRDTGTVFDALTARDSELADAIVELERRRSTRSPPSDRALAETIQIFPTFQRGVARHAQPPRPSSPTTPSRWSRT